MRRCAFVHWRKFPAATTCACTLGLFTGILGKHGVSISAVTQRAVPQAGGHVPVVVLTHAARESQLDAALAEIQAAGVVSEKPKKLRMLD